VAEKGTKTKTHRSRTN